ncbi:MAG TPA: DUF1360 domain-containing protein [Thermoleophilaceae bacterium]|nr:DUF1360 domain-containing protein [Thermoleophilaceae bacterium]
MAVPVKDSVRSGDPVQEPQPRERPVRGYATLTGLFLTLVASFSAWIRASGRELPEKVSPGDLALVAIATHKASRLIAKERVTSAVRAPFTEVEPDPRAPRPKFRERARGEGVRRAVGELVLCPYCLSVWIATAFAGGLVVAPRPTRFIAGILTTVFGSDVLQIAYKKAEDSL